MILDFDPHSPLASAWAGLLDALMPDDTPGERDMLTVVGSALVMTATRHVDPPPDHYAYFGFVDEFGAELDLAAVPPPIVWAMRMMSAGVGNDHEQLFALVRSQDRSQLVQGLTALSMMAHSVAMESDHG
jgi:hypothetical protein